MSDTHFHQEEVEKRIGYLFRNPALLKQAMTHSSFANEQKINKQEHYERLEFLGDAVLEMCSSEFLFHQYPNLQEGKLSKMRASFVCEPYLAFCARKLGLENDILLGKGEETTGGRQRDSIISDVFEAVIGAVFLDGGIDAAKAFIDRAVLQDLDGQRLFVDSKSALQEWVQSIHQGELQYVLLEVTGPEHCQEFHVQVELKGTVLGEGRGKNKKTAEQQAAVEALRRLQNQESEKGSTSSCI